MNNFGRRFTNDCISIIKCAFGASVISLRTAAKLYPDIPLRKRSSALCSGGEFSILSSQTTSLVSARQNRRCILSIMGERGCGQYGDGKDGTVFGEGHFEPPESRDVPLHHARQRS